MTKTIVGLFASHDDAQKVVQQLLDHKISAEHISLVGGADERTVQQTKERRDREDASVTAGGSLVALAGLSTVLIPGIGLILAAGPIGAAIGAVAAGTEDESADDRRLHRALTHIGMTEAEAHGYAMNVQRGQTLVAVNADDQQTDLVADIFHRHGSTNLSFRRHTEA